MSYISNHSPIQITFVYSCETKPGQNMLVQSFHVPYIDRKIAVGMSIFDALKIHQVNIAKWSTCLQETYLIIYVSYFWIGLFSEGL